MAHSVFCSLCAKGKEFILICGHTIGCESYKHRCHVFSSEVSICVCRCRRSTGHTRLHLFLGFLNRIVVFLEDSCVVTEHTCSFLVVGVLGSTLRWSGRQ